MKKIIICSILLITATISFSQQNNPSATLSKQHYLHKSKIQKTVGWIMLGGGIVMIPIGIAIGSQADSFSDEAVVAAGLTLVGIGTALGSIPFFIASSRNKKKA